MHWIGAKELNFTRGMFQVCHPAGHVNYQGSRSKTAHVTLHPYLRIAWKESSLVFLLTGLRSIVGVAACNYTPPTCQTFLWFHDLITREIKLFVNVIRRLARICRCRNSHCGLRATAWRPEPSCKGAHQVGILFGSSDG